MQTEKNNKTKKSNQQKAANLIQYWSYGYYHFIIETLPKFAQIHDTFWSSDHSDMGLIVDNIGHVIDFFKSVMGIPEHRLIKNTGSIAVEELFFIPHTVCDFPIVQNLLRSAPITKTSFSQFLPAKHKIHKYANTKRTRELVFRKLGIDIVQNRTNHSFYDEIPGDYIVVANRNPSKGRSIQNFDEMIGDLKEKFPGEEIKAIYFERMSMADQIRLLSRAKMYIGPHGAGLVNMLWMPLHSSTTIFEFMPDRYPITVYYKLAAQLRFQYW